MPSSPRPLAAALENRTTVYLSRNADEVFLRGRCLVLKSGGSECALPLERVRRVVLLGKPPVAATLLYRIMRAGITIDWLDIFGRPAGQIIALDEEREFNPAAQAAFARDGAALELARQMLLAKVDNCREVIRRRVEPDPAWPERREALEKAADPAALRGAEGMAARMYFALWPGLLDVFQWHGRHPHPAPDPVNMLLSLGYGLLHNRLSSALASRGLNPRMGFFHQGRGRHCALASDLMEPFRPLVDAAVLRLIRRREIRPEQFRMRNGRCVCGDRPLFVKLLENFEEMFAAPRVFYPDAEKRDLEYHESLNSCFDELAHSFFRHITTGAPCFIPRLRPCAAT